MELVCGEKQREQKTDSNPERQQQIASHRYRQTDRQTDRTTFVVFSGHRRLDSLCVGRIACCQPPAEGFLSFYFATYVCRSSINQTDVHQLRLYCRDSFVSNFFLFMLCPNATSEFAHCRKEIMITMFYCMYTLHTPKKSTCNWKNKVSPVVMFQTKLANGKSPAACTCILLKKDALLNKQNSQAVMFRRRNEACQ